jgi:hypothetical protein
MRLQARHAATAASLVLAAASAITRDLGAQTPRPPSLTREQQIASAVLPAPADQRDGATVLGYGPDQRLITLREGNGLMVCLADDPADDRFHVACYHRALEPFMALGRELRSRGLSPQAVDSARFAQIESGRLRMPAAASLYSITGQAGSYDPAANEVRGGRSLYVVYLPYATAASTGLSTAPARGTPWLMDPGTPKAHVMYTPPPR